MGRFKDRLIHAWNAFINQDTSKRIYSYGDTASYGSRPDRVRLRWSNERSIIASIYTRMSIDAASVDIRHVRLDNNDRYLEDIDSGLQSCLTLRANKDQNASHFRQDIFLTLFDKGCCALVPVDTTVDPSLGSFDIQTMRVGEITGWMPDHVKVMVYNDRKGLREEIVLEKKFVAIVENPLHAVMNEANSTLQRIIRKLNQLDAIDEQSSSGKLDILIQLPFAIKSESRRATAEQRRTDLETQLRGSKYGIGYVDGTEKVIQLNRPAENNLLKQVEFLMPMLYGQLGLTEDVMNGTADEKAMINYWNRTVEPLARAVAEAMRSTFLSKTARTQKQSILFFRDPFKFVPLTELAEIVDKFTRNEVMSANEIRGAIGVRPSKDPKADELHNSNMPEPTPPPEPTSVQRPPIKVGEAKVNRPQLTSAPSEPSNKTRS